jgi:glycosyltransferase involved in cell wall biosynthesis
MAYSNKRKNKLEICIICGSNPSFLGGVSIYCNNLIKSFKKRGKITWIYKGKENKTYSKKGIRYIELKVKNKAFLGDFSFNKKIAKILKKEKFDIINSHATWGYWLKYYKKEKNQIIVHTYHGSTYHFYKNHFNRPDIIKKLTSSAGMVFGKIIEKPPFFKADKIIYVSNKVKEQMEKNYGKRNNSYVLRTGNDLKNFIGLDKKYSRKKVGLKDNLIYGLYVGQGGYWTKGLDRAIKISEEINNKMGNFRLLVIGPDYKKVKNLLKNKIISFIRNVPRDKMKYYYASSNVFFCLSRYEGGAPTLTVSEAMASGCLLVCSKDSKQEIIKEKENGLIINDSKEDVDKIINLLKDNKRRKEIIKNSIREVKNYDLINWSNKYWKILSL